MYSRHPPAFAYHTPSYTGNPQVPGASVTMGFSNTPGTAVGLITTPLTHDVELLEIVINCNVTATALTATDTSAFIDILIDPAGGTAWDTTNILIEGLMAGFIGLQSSTGVNFGRHWSFPLWVPAGATIAARGQSMVASGSVQVEVEVNAFGGINNPSSYWCGTKVDAIGLNRATSKGVDITPNASANTYGAFASIGSPTTRRYGCLIPFVCASNGTAGGTRKQAEIGIGGAKIGKTFNYNVSTGEIQSDFMEVDKRIYMDVPEGTQLQARNRSNGVTGAPDQVIIHGVA